MTLTNQFIALAGTIKPGHVLTLEEFALLTEFATMLQRQQEARSKGGKQLTPKKVKQLKRASKKAGAPIGNQNWKGKKQDQD